MSRDLQFKIKEMLSFKIVRDKDLPFIEKVYRSTREDELKKTNWTDDQKERFVIMQSMAQTAEYQKKYPGAEHQIIFYKNKPAGRLFTWESGAQFHLIDITILPEFKNKGIGSSVLKGLIMKTVQQKKRFTLFVARDNPAKRLYEKLGFKTIASLDTREEMEYINLL